MKVFAATKESNLATVYMADMGDGRLLEFVEACQPPFGRAERWILMISTLFGCPVKCLMCDAGGSYHETIGGRFFRKWTTWCAWFPDGTYRRRSSRSVRRMGEPPSTAVLEVLERSGSYARQA
jgi:23S rRNA (adenine2503-C2)-methyltransferase